MRSLLGDVRRGMFARFRPDRRGAHCRATLRPLAGDGYRLRGPSEVSIGHSDMRTAHMRNARSAFLDSSLTPHL
jgi:hypothetical protein